MSFIEPALEASSSSRVTTTTLVAVSCTARPSFSPVTTIVSGSDAGAEEEAVLEASPAPSIPMVGVVWKTSTCAAASCCA